MKQKYLAMAAGLAPALLFVLLGLAFIPMAGVQYDEVLFQIVLFASPDFTEHTMKLGPVLIPIMLMTYMGTVKALLWWPIFELVGMNHLTLRLPAILVTSGAIFLFYSAARRLTSARVALLGSLLLATDACYLLTSVYDWGPVALQHLLIGVAFYAGVRYSEQQKQLWLLVLGCAAGLALWNKAIVVWILLGTGAAALIVAWRPILSLMRNRRAALLLVGGFVIGAAPFLYYNKVHKLKTFTSSANVDATRKLEKMRTLDSTLNGSGLFGYLVRNQAEGEAPELKTWEKASLWLSETLKGPRRSAQQLLFVCCWLALPLLWAGPWGRWATFAFFAFMLAWIPMMLTRGAGGGIHHTVLLWPWPHLMVVFVAADVARRLPRRGMAVAAAAVLIACAGNLAVVNQYMAQLIAFGPTVYFTDASRQLAASLGRTQGRLVFTADWGISQQLDFYSHARIGYHRGAEGALLNIDDPATRKFIDEQLADPATVFVTHAEGREVFVGVRAKLLEHAASLGYTARLADTIHDRHGVPMFEIYEFRK